MAAAQRRRRTAAQRRRLRCQPAAGAADGAARHSSGGRGAQRRSSPGFTGRRRLARYRSAAAGGNDEFWRPCGHRLHRRRRRIAIGAGGALRRRFCGAGPAERPPGRLAARGGRVKAARFAVPPAQMERTGGAGAMANGVLSVVPAAAARPAGAAPTRRDLSFASVRSGAAACRTTRRERKIFLTPAAPEAGAAGGRPPG